MWGGGEGGGGGTCPSPPYLIRAGSGGEYEGTPHQTVPPHTPDIKPSASTSADSEYVSLNRLCGILVVLCFINIL